MVSCDFLSQNKTSSKQNLNLISILQPLLVGIEINTTLKETLINITELTKKIPLITKFEQFTIVPSTIRSSLSIRGRRILSLT